MDDVGSRAFDRGKIIAMRYFLFSLLIVTVLMSGCEEDFECESMPAGMSININGEKKCGKPEIVLLMPHEANNSPGCGDYGLWIKTGLHNTASLYGCEEIVLNQTYTFDANGSQASFGSTNPITTKDASMIITFIDEVEMTISGNFSATWENQGDDGGGTIQISMNKVTYEIEETF